MTLTEAEVEKWRYQVWAELLYDHSANATLTKERINQQPFEVGNEYDQQLERTILDKEFHKVRRNPGPKPPNQQNDSEDVIFVRSRCTICDQDTGTVSDSYPLYHRDPHIFQNFAAVVAILDQCRKAPQARNSLLRFGVLHAGEKHWALARMTFARGLTERQDLWWPEGYSPFARWVHSEYVARHQYTTAVYPRPRRAVKVRYFDWRWYVSELMEEIYGVLRDIGGEYAVLGLCELWYQALMDV